MLTPQEWLYAIALCFYMQAMPLKLVVISTFVNIVVVAVKWYWEI